nr:hypothetical protein [uncultured Agathobaculum sp.]
MTQNARRRFLIQSLLSERPEYRNAELPADEGGQRRLRRFAEISCPDFVAISQ